MNSQDLLEELQFQRQGTSSSQILSNLFTTQSNNSSDEVDFESLPIQAQMLVDGFYGSNDPRIPIKGRGRREALDTPLKPAHAIKLQVIKIIH